MKEHVVYYTSDEVSGLHQMWCITCSKNGEWRRTWHEAQRDADNHHDEVSV